MGFALLFARKLYNTSRTNQLNYETISIQNRQTHIANQIAGIEKMASNLEQDSPDKMYLEAHKQMLTFMSQNLELRLQCISTQLAQIAAEENSVNESLNAQIQASVPKYLC